MQKEDINFLFNKVFRFKNNHWSTPETAYSGLSWSIPLLKANKDELNYTKSLLNNFNLKEWSHWTKSRDPSSSIIQKLKHTVKPELLTQAWCKFYECLYKFPLVSHQAINDKVVKSLHLCEAPGAFICALNHFLKSKSPAFQLDWQANTLNPNYEGNLVQEMITDDRLIKYTQNKWLFGDDNTGDIRIFENYLNITKQINRQGKRSLVTADGSIDCSFDPGNQELIVSHLIYCETMCALSVLESGGSFVLKIFTMFEDKTINILYLLNCTFKEVLLFKPCSSKSGNSEIYVICLYFKGEHCLKHIWQELLIPYKQGKLETNNLSMFKNQDLPHMFLVQIKECSELFMHLQMRTINNNIYYFKNRFNDKNIFKLKVRVAQKYLSKYKLTRIANDLKIIPNMEVLSTWRNTYNFKFNDQFLCLSVDDLIRHDISDVDVKLGKPIESVKYSKFILNETLLRLKQTRSGLYNCCINALRPVFTVIDGTGFKDSLTKFHDYVYTNVIGCENKNILFINVPFITHFLAGVLFILIRAYTYVSFNKKGLLILNHVNNENIIEVKQQLIKIGGKFDLSRILEVVPANVFDENPLFYELVWFYNNNLS